jgi:hypothetical protein
MTALMREVRLPADLCESAQARFGKQFSTVEDLLVFVLKELVRDDAHKMDENEKRMIEERLRGLGYL